MAFDFPSNPVDGQVFEIPGGLRYVYNNPAWRANAVQELGNYATQAYVDAGDLTQRNYTDAQFATANAYTDAAVSGLGSYVDTNLVLKVNKTGDTLSGTLVGKASDPAGASFTLPHGTAPASPANGDLWSTTSGVFARVNGVTIGPFGTAGSGGIADAPNDGQTYGRKNLGWTVMSGGGGIADAPSNGSQYVRLNATWSVSAPPWTAITGKPATFAPTLPIAQSGVTNLVSDLALKAPLASPALTGVPTAPTATPTTATTQLATTAFVGAAMTARVNWYDSTFNYPGRAIQIIDQDSIPRVTIMPGQTTIEGATLGIKPRSDDVTNDFNRIYFYDKSDITRGYMLVDHAGATGSVTIASRNNAGTTDASLVISPAGMNMGNKKVVNVAAPAASNDAATKGYVDGAFLPLAGGVMSGSIKHNDVLILESDSDATTRQFKFDTNGDFLPWRHVRLQQSGSTNFPGLQFVDASAVTHGNIAYGFTSEYIQMSCNTTVTQRLFYFKADGSAEKLTAGSWNAVSDGRIKRVLRDYAPGLAEVLQLKPKVFNYLGNDYAEDPMVMREGAAPKSPHADMLNTEVVGMIAQEIEVVMPETVVKGPGWIDGQPVTDLRTFDPSNLVYALVNAVKQLSAEVDILKGQIAA